MERLKIGDKFKYVCQDRPDLNHYYTRGNTYIVKDISDRGVFMSVNHGATMLSWSRSSINEPHYWCPVSKRILPSWL